MTSWLTGPTRISKKISANIPCIRVNKIRFSSKTRRISSSGSWRRKWNDSVLNIFYFNNFQLYEKFIDKFIEAPFKSIVQCKISRPARKSLSCAKRKPWSPTSVPTNRTPSCCTKPSESWTLPLRVWTPMTSATSIIWSSGRPQTYIPKTQIVCNECKNCFSSSTRYFFFSKCI